MQSPGRETRCCSSLARSCSVQAAHCKEEKSPFVLVKWAEKSGTPALSRKVESSKGSGSQATSPPPPKCGVSPSPWTPTLAQCPHCGMDQRPPVPLQPSSHCPGLGGAATPHSPAGPEKAPVPCCARKEWPWALLPDLPVPGLRHLPTLM